MMKSAVVFAGRNGLDVSDLRLAVLRIPEVSVRVKEAQQILDGMELPKMDLHNYIVSDNDHFLRNIKLKSLASAVVQVGLYERHLKYQRQPDVLVGNSNGDSALSVVTGRVSFEEMLKKSQALQTLKPVERLAVVPTGEEAPLLSGISLTEYAVCSADSNETVRGGMMDFRKLFTVLHEDLGIRQYISVGPANALLGPEFKNFGYDDIEVLDSVEMDPMLSWFWRNMRPMTPALAQ